MDGCKTPGQESVTDLVQGDCSLWDRRNSRYKLNLGLVWFGLQIWSKEIVACGTGGTPGINLISVWFGLVRFSLV